jgi:hypothetical protein
MLRIIGIVFALVALATPAVAAEDWWWEEIQREGFSLGVSGKVGGMTGIKNFADGTRADIESGTAGGLGVRAGYRLPKWVGLDLHFEWMTSDATASFQRELPVDVGSWWITFTGDFKFIAPRWANSEFYAIVGPGLMTIDGTTEFAARYGAGVDIYLTRSVGMNLGGSYVMPIDDLEDFGYAVGEIGLFYRF